jgi:hypothetical protein
MDIKKDAPQQLFKNITGLSQSNGIIFNAGEDYSFVYKDSEGQIHFETGTASDFDDPTDGTQESEGKKKAKRRPMIWSKNTTKTN